MIACKDLVQALQQVHDHAIAQRVIDRLRIPAGVHEAIAAQLCQVLR